MVRNVARSAILITAVSGLFSLVLCGAGQSESVRAQCSAKYQAAKAGGTLNGQSWNQFYSACAAEAKAGGTPPPAAEPAAPPPVIPAAAPAAPPPAAVAPKPKKTVAAPAEPAAPAPVPTGPIVFPTAISPQYSSLTPHHARQKTCGEQFRANEATNSNGGLKWNPKGGGYYSLCNKKLKGES